MLLGFFKNPNAEEITQGVGTNGPPPEQTYIIDDRYALKSWKQPGGGGTNF